jgi:hypothetical protein
METSGYITDFNNIEKAELNEQLRHFFAEAKPKNNEERATSMIDEHVQVYHKNTLKNIRTALNRHTKELNRNFDIVHVSDFRTSSIIYDSTMKMMIKTGLSQLTKHKEIIGHQDLQLINAYLNNNPKNPVLLRLRFWFNLAIHFVSRGLEFHHQLNTGTLLTFMSMLKVMNTRR